MPRSTDPTIAAGELDTRVTLLQPLYNDVPDEIVGWQEVAKAWAAIDPSYGQEVNQAGRTVSITLTPIVIRYRTDIDTRWRVQSSDRLFEVKGILDIARRHVQLQLTCEEIQ